MTTAISGNRPLLPTAATAPSEPLAQKSVLPAEVSAKRMVANPQDLTAFAPAAKVASGMPALLGGAAGAVGQKVLGAQAVLGTALEALATAQAGLQQVAGLASGGLAQFAGLQGAAAGALSGAAQMPMNIANQVASAFNGGSGARQLDVLQGMAHSQGALSPANVEAGAYSADQLGQQYADPSQYGEYADPSQYGAYADPGMEGAYADPAAGDLSQFFGAAELAGGAAELVGGVADLANLRKPSGPEGKPSAPQTQSPSKPNGLESKPSAPDAKPSAPDVKPSSFANKADDLAKGALKTGGKALGRFVPGANIAIAGLDIANAVQTFKDPNASVGDKVTSGIIAGGSALAATNIPIVSQVGGAISTGVSLGSEVVKNFGGEIKDVAKKVGEGVKDTAEKVGEGIKDTAEKVGEGIKDTAKKVGEGVKDFFKGW
ncbi:hypothetical protein SAMN05444354_101832 [Stigmatella aurantiaca]|uniref:Uncharacterized protein n=1 Tax=Stigmatella aurantiaca TaxID=41 RepID=A0A1H7HV46_STIAU|nr:hypothetical protein [Stigmatella aurantiaca]SEK54223.1 hypothetical protein SAMN05444354_101832 [Stigmatella aurantiaca]